MHTLNDPADLDQIMVRIDKLEPTTEPLWGKMTANEMLCHVSDPIRDFLKQRDARSMLPSFLRPLAKLVLLNMRSFGRNAPTAKSYLQSPKGKGTKPQSFDADKQQLKVLLNDFVAKDAAFKFGHHAIMGSLTKKQAGAFIWKHLHHHLSQFGV